MFCDGFRRVDRIAPSAKSSRNSGNDCPDASWRIFPADWLRTVHSSARIECLQPQDVAAKNYQRRSIRPSPGRRRCHERNTDHRPDQTTTRPAASWFALRSKFRSSGTARSFTRGRYRPAKPDHGNCRFGTNSVWSGIQNRCGLLTPTRESGRLRTMGMNPLTRICSLRRADIAPVAQG